MNRIGISTVVKFNYILTLVIFLDCSNWLKDSDPNYQYHYSEDIRSYRDYEKRNKIGLFSLCDPLRFCIEDCYEKIQLSDSNNRRTIFRKKYTYTEKILNCEDSCKKNVFCYDKY